MDSIDVANTILKRAFDAGLRITPKQLFAALREVAEQKSLFEDENWTKLAVHGKAPEALIAKFRTFPTGVPITKFIPRADGSAQTVPALAEIAGHALGLA